MSSKTYRICTLPGDGIGPEIMVEAKKVLAVVGEKYDVEFDCTDRLIGGAAIEPEDAGTNRGAIGKERREGFALMGDSNGLDSGAILGA